MTTIDQHSFTFRELANIALGSPELTSQHLNVLYGLIICLLRKLGCNNETVKITDATAVCLKKLLNSCDVPLYTFNYDNKNNSLVKHTRLLNQLESRVAKCTEKLEAHFKEIRKCHAKNVQTIVWEQYSKKDEEIGYGPKTEWLLKNNAYFNYRLRQYVTKPMVDKIIDFEGQMKTSSDTIAQCRRKIEKSSTTIGKIAKLQTDILKLEFNINNMAKVFTETIEEIDDMLICKVDRIAFPALKITLQTWFNHVFEQLDELTAKKATCLTNMKPMSKVQSKNICLSCGQVPEQFCAIIRKSDKSYLNKCQCERLNETSLIEKVSQMKYKTIPVTGETISMLKHHVSFTNRTNKAQWYISKTFGFELYSDHRNMNAQKRHTFAPLITYRTDHKSNLNRKTSTLRFSTISTD